MEKKSVPTSEFDEKIHGTPLFFEEKNFPIDKAIKLFLILSRINELNTGSRAAILMLNKIRKQGFKTASVNIHFNIQGGTKIIIA